MTKATELAPALPPKEGRREHILKLIGLCEERLRTHPNDVRSLMDIARALWDMRQKAGAIEYLGKILARHPGHAEVRETLQRYCAELGAGGFRRGIEEGQP